MTTAVEQSEVEALEVAQSMATTDLSAIRRQLKRLEKARLAGVFVVRSEGPNRKQRRKAAAERRAGK